MVDVNNLKIKVNEIYPAFGPTRQQEISRLLYEIAKRETIDFTDVIADIPDESNQNFSGIKEYLLKRRFPNNKAINGRQFPLTKLDIDIQNKAHIEPKNIYPKNIYIETDAKESALAKRMRVLFPDSTFETISSYKEFSQSRPYTIKDYNDRLNHFFITNEKYDFFKNCPCSPQTVSCGYHIVNMGSGCAFECTYCYLQGFLNAPGIVLPANLDDFFTEFKKYKQDVRIGSGEYTDSLVFDHITQYSPRIVEFFNQYPKSTFEFKTKSTNIDLLLTAKPAGNIVVSWTVNTPKVAETIELLTPSIEERLKAAVKCMQAGYKIGFHFDPVIYYNTWEHDYETLVNRIFDLIDPNVIAWISLGTLRMNKQLRHTIENRFPDTDILNTEMIFGHDHKIRYDEKLRMTIYKKMTEWIRKRSPEAKLYLCMEEKSLCQSCSTFPFKKEDHRVTA